ncbi:MAG: ParM/StbA family protein [Ruminiclostridium sp.]|nr:ParM/StbA family protein [Ruminiclostridium sp.]
MRKLNSTMVIAVDHGYGNIKTVNTVTPTGITAYDTEPTFTGDILQYSGKFYRIGEGHKPFLSDKTMDEDFYVLNLAAIAKELDIEGITTADVHIAAGLPLTWVKTQREEFRKYLTKNSKVKFAFRDKQYNIKIVGASVYPQGYTAVIDRLSEMIGVNMLADIGNGTMNVMYINNKKPVESKCFTEKLGVNQCVIKASGMVLDRFGTILDETIIEQMIRTGTADIGEKYLDCITDAIKEYSSYIFETLRKYEYDSELMRLYITGGGATLIKHFGEYDENRVTIIEDICAAAKGYEILAYNALLREQEQPKKPAKPKTDKKTDVPTENNDISENTTEEVSNNADGQSDKPSTES